MPDDVPIAEIKSAIGDSARSTAWRQSIASLFAIIVTIRENWPTLEAVYDVDISPNSITPWKEHCERLRDVELWAVQNKYNLSIQDAHVSELGPTPQHAQEHWKRTFKAQRETAKYNVGVTVKGASYVKLVKLASNNPVPSEIVDDIHSHPLFLGGQLGVWVPLQPPPQYTTCGTIPSTLLAATELHRQRKSGVWGKIPPREPGAGRPTPEPKICDGYRQ